MADIIYKSPERRRSNSDKIISGLNSIRYSLSEPALLFINRLLHEKEYNPSSPYYHGDEPFITVYTPTYNRARILLERAVASVLAQSYKNFEFIIVGDHCTDETEELLKKVGDRRVKFYNIPVRKYRYPPTAENHWLAGPVVAANTALKMASGKWIARTDDDDIWTPDHLESLIQFAIKGNYEFVSARYIEERHGKRREDTGVHALDRYYTRKEIHNYQKSPRIGGTQTWLYRSYLKFFKYNINCWRKAWNRVNDVDLSQRIFKAGVRMGFLDKVVTYVLPRPGETTVGLEAYQIQENEKLKQYQFER